MIRATLSGCGARPAIPRSPTKTTASGFSRFPLSVRRLSGQPDVIYVIATGEQLQPLLPLEGRRLTVEGQLRSFNNKSGQGSRLVISVFARVLTEAEENDDCNEIQLQGVLCKPPVLRRTPLGRCICDMMLAVNRRYGRADYLPCIAWGQVAVLTGRLGYRLPPGPGGPGPEPDLHQDRGRPAPGAHRLRGQRDAPGGSGPGSGAGRQRDIGAAPAQMRPGPLPFFFVFSPDFVGKPTGFLLKSGASYCIMRYCAGGGPMAALTLTIGPELDGRTVQAVLKGQLGLSSTCIGRLKRTESGLRLNGRRVFTNAVLPGRRIS